MFPAAVAGSCASLAALFLLFPLLPRVREANYDEAVRLALTARAGDAVIEQIQTAYGRCPECAIVHGLPVSSRQILYLYADSEMDARTADRLFRATRRFVRRHRWTVGDIWPVNAPAGEGLVSREVGLIAAIPRQRPTAFREDVMQITVFAADLKSRFGINFVLGFYDAASQRNEDLLLVDSGQPGLVRLQAAVDRLEQLLERVTPG
jgi:hypothetical protein